MMMISDDGSRSRTMMTSVGVLGLVGMFWNIGLWWIGGMYTISVCSWKIVDMSGDLKVWSYDIVIHVRIWYCSSNAAKFEPRVDDAF